MKFYRKSLRPKLLFYDEGGVTFTGCECTIQFDELKQTLQTLKNQGIDTAIETNASHSRLTELFEHIDQLIMDCKEIQRDCDKKFSGLPDCIKIAKTQVEVAKNIPLWISDYSIFAGTQDDLFAMSYALISQSCQRTGRRFD